MRYYVELRIGRSFDGDAICDTLAECMEFIQTQGVEYCSTSAEILDNQTGNKFKIKIERAED